VIQGVLKTRAHKGRAPRSARGIAASAAQRRAIRSHAVAEMAALDEVSEATAAGVTAPLTEAQIDRLNAVLRPFFPPTGDPQRFVTH
jgi:hypothetical protein